MPYFSYRARDENGVLRTDRVEAADKSTVEYMLDGMGLIPISITPVKESFFSTLSADLFTGITQQELILFSRQLATLTTAGIPLTKALTTLHVQMSNPRFQAVIKKIIADVEGGSTFTGALAFHSRVFPEYYSSMVEAGETGGILDEVLDRLALMLEKTAETRSKVISAMMYPAMVLVVLVMAVVALMILAVPKFVSLYSGMKLELPLPTRVLILLSDAFTNYWWVGLIAVAATVSAYRYLVSTEKGMIVRDSLLLRIPIFGTLILKSILSKFSRVLGSLYASGLPILHSLDIVSRAVNNRVISAAVKTIAEEIRAGKGIAEPMSNISFFPPMVVQMVAVGEESGNLEDMLSKVAEYYENDVDITIRYITTLIEPVLLFVVLFVVLGLALAVYMPMWDMVKAVKR